MMIMVEGGLVYQCWLVMINQVCGYFVVWLLEESFYGEIDVCYVGSFKVSIVIVVGVNFYCMCNEIKCDNDVWFYIVFQFVGEVIFEQDDCQVMLVVGDIMLIDVVCLCFIVWQQILCQVLLLLLCQWVVFIGDIIIVCWLDKFLLMVQFSQ